MFRKNWALVAVRKSPISLSLSCVAIPTRAGFISVQEFTTDVSPGECSDLRCVSFTSPGLHRRFVHCSFQTLDITQRFKPCQSWLLDIFLICLPCKQQRWMYTRLLMQGLSGLDKRCVDSAGVAMARTHSYIHFDSHVGSL